MRLWIARDRDGSLNIYNNKPKFKEETGEFYFADKFPNRWFGCLDDNMFQEITWENSPREIELKLKE